MRGEAVHMPMRAARLVAALLLPVLSLLPMAARASFSAGCTQASAGAYPTGIFGEGNRNSYCGVIGLWPGSFKLTTKWAPGTTSRFEFLVLQGMVCDETEPGQECDPRTSDAPILVRIICDVQLGIAGCTDVGSAARTDSVPPLGPLVSTFITESTSSVFTIDSENKVVCECLASSTGVFISDFGDA